MGCHRDWRTTRSPLAEAHPRGPRSSRTGDRRIESRCPRREGPAAETPERRSSRSNPRDNDRGGHQAARRSGGTRVRRPGVPELAANGPVSRIAASNRAACIANVRGAQQKNRDAGYTVRPIRGLQATMRDPGLGAKTRVEPTGSIHHYEGRNGLSATELLSRWVRFG